MEVLSPDRDGYVGLVVSPVVVLIGTMREATMRPFTSERIESPVMASTSPACCAVPQCIWNRSPEGVRIPASRRAQGTKEALRATCYRWPGRSMSQFEDVL